ncbi:Flagellar biosynthesis protein FlhF [Candidatus Syntrophocurvum alkaliphilum]|uniref:Flagellar biosynthesis protein FlhF n=1 Tax=Candidatus Syntrophocurvum alkaliphilum TaxID=2293317 RepID=A0A6I6DCV1_9FIRM|nr:flagellar biosynthesis protein FlhF [Candidatus Syntrophocurvum alkaliphilum]QGT99184.1 Flagellar biosynthesis protein FlhF [Candidatus Syntrophocurvum alkaliphilum]
MKIKKFVADDFQTAIMQAKREMGSEAIILYTKKVKKGGFLGLFSSTKVEVTVGIDDDVKIERDNLSNKSNSPSAKDNKISDEFKNLLNQPPKDNEIVSELHKMKDIMSDVKSKMYDLEVIKGLSEPLQNFYNSLIEENVDKEIALEIINNIQLRLSNETNNDIEFEELCLNTIKEYLRNIRPIELTENSKAKVIVFVGPTGVGKTTTIAKLAANSTFIEGKDVALITLDTYRISAAEQLKTFAEIIDIPIRVIFNPKDLHDSLQYFNDKDLIFIDTAGRSPYKLEHMNELKEFMEVAKPDESILVLSVTTSSTELINIYEKFNELGVDKLIFTKLDETQNYGHLLNVIYEINKPVAYFTTGQNVPDDIEVPDGLRFANKVIRKEESHERPSR